MATPQPEPQYIRTIRAAKLLFWGFGGMAVWLVGIVAIIYFAIAEQWVAAIFALLARKDLVRWMQEKFDKTYEEVKQVNSAV